LGLDIPTLISPGG